jgi:predicted MFS family arabinose efflux permease
LNLASGIALLVASGLAGLLWDRFGAGSTFVAGGVISALALLVLASFPRRREPGACAP